MADDAAASTTTRAPPRRAVSNISMPKKKAGLFGTSSNLVNSIVGAGIIGIPYAIRNSGFVVGILLLVLVGYLTDKSLRLIIELASFHPKLHNMGVLTYEDLLQIPYGRAGRAFILGNMFVLAYGAMVAYLLIIKDTVPVILGLGEAGQGGTFVEKELVMFVTSLCIMLPLGMLRDMAQLSFTSFLSVTADAILVIFVIVYAPIKTSVSNAGGFGQVLKDGWIAGRLFIGLGVISTAMACQHSAFIVAGSLENKTSARWAKVTAWSIATATVLSMMMGIAGYLGFLDKTEGDVLNNFRSGDTIANAGRTLLAITMFFTYPMESFVARHVLGRLFFGGNLDGDTVGNDGQTVPGQRVFLCLGRRSLVSIGLYVATLIPALIVDDLGPVLSLTGAIGASSVAFIGPGLAYFGINGEDFLQWTANLLHSKGYSVDHGKPQGSSGGEIELPTVGDASATMQSAPEPTHPGRGAKPFWYYLGLFPIWVALASSGAHGSKTFLAGHLESSSGGGDTNNGESSSAEEPKEDEDSGEIIGPRKHDYFISMFFIVFGVIALVVGVASNIWVQIHDINHLGNY